MQNNAVPCPGQGDAAVIRLRPLEAVAGYQPGAVTRGLAATVDCNARYGYLNLYEGAKVQLPLAARQPEQRWDRLLFGEGGARIVVSVSPAHQAAWEGYLAENLAGSWQRLGQVEGDRLVLLTQDGQTVITDTVQQLAQIWGSAIRDRLAA